MFAPGAGNPDGTFRQWREIVKAMGARQPNPLTPFPLVSSDTQEGGTENVREGGTAQCVLVTMGTKELDQDGCMIGAVIM